MARTISPEFKPSVKEIMLKERYKTVLQRELEVVQEKKLVIEELWDLHRDNR